MKMVNGISVTGGKYRSRRLATPGGKTHPMGERERLALFNMLTGLLSGAKVLDAFSGSGALGIEALSRGAENVVFIDKSAEATKTIQENLKTLDITDGFKVLKSSVSEAAGGLNEFDVVLADPPYDDFRLIEVECLVPLVKKGGILVLSHLGEAPDLQGLVLDKTHKYAGARISIYHK